MRFAGAIVGALASRALPGCDAERWWAARESGGCTTGSFLASLWLRDRLQQPDGGAVRRVRRFRTLDCGAVRPVGGFGSAIAESSGVFTNFEATFAEP